METVSEETSDGSPSVALPRGTTLGRFVVLEPLGEGGAGRVYAAYDYALDRRVALKVLRNPQDELRGARLRREARALARLNHPNVVTVHELAAQDGLTFLALEHVEGGTLAQWLERGPHRVGEVLARFVAAARGLAQAHRAGVVHRDFKPHNVLLGSDGRVRVTDFGLAMETQPSLAAAPGLSLAPPSADVETVSGAVLGTPAFMAPEQRAGEAVGPAADQYALCNSLQRALHGEPAFGWPPAAGRVPRRVRRALARGLAALPAERFSDLEALITALSGANRRRRLAVAGVVAVALAGAAAFGWTRLGPPACRSASRRVHEVWSPSRRDQVRSALVRAPRPYSAEAAQRTVALLDAYAERWAKAHEDACLATHERGEQSPATRDLRLGCLSQRLWALDALAGELSRDDARAAELGPSAAAALASVDECASSAALLGAPPAPAAEERVERLARQLAEVRAKENLGRYGPGLELAAAAVRDARALGYPPLLAEALWHRGSLEWRQGQVEPAEATLFEAFETAAASRADALAARAALSLGRVAAMRVVGDGDRWRRIAEAFVARFGGDDAWRADLAELAAEVAFLRRNLDEAIALHQAAGTLRAKSGGRLFERRAHTLQRLAEALKERGRTEEALAANAEALAVLRELFGPGHPRSAWCLARRGQLLLSHGLPEQAEPTLREALALLERAVGPHHPMLAGAFNSLGSTLADLGRARESLEAYERALAQYEKTVGPKGMAYATTLMNVGMMLGHVGEVERARRTLVESRRLMEESVGPSHVDLAMSLIEEGKLLLRSGKPAEAVSLLERAYALRAQKDVDPVARGEVGFALARALWERGSAGERARLLARQALKDYEAAGARDPKSRAEVEAFVARIEGASRTR